MKQVLIDSGPGFSTIGFIEDHHVDAYLMIHPARSLERLAMCQYAVDIEDKTEIVLRIRKDRTNVVSITLNTFKKMIDYGR